MAPPASRTPGATQGAGRIAQRRPPAGAASPLRHAMQQLYSLKPTREVFAEEAAKLLCKSAAAKAAALLLYDQRQDRVRVVASDGLEEDAIQVLGAEGPRGGWDIPVRALRSRRINVIESAQANPFVPKALVAVNPRQLTIAVIPFYHGNLPVGVAVLFAPTQRGFPDRMLQTVSQALHICALALTELPPTAGELPRVEDEVRAQPTLLRGVATLKAELSRLSRALEEAERQRAAEAAERVTAESFLQAQRERVAALEKEVETLRGEQERAATLEAELAQLRTDLAESRATSEAGRAEIARLHSALSEAQEGLKKEAAAVKELETLRDELQGRLDDALATNVEREATIATLQGQVEELSRTAEKLSEAQKSLAQREEERQRLEGEVAGLQAELERARAQGAELSAQVESLRGDGAATKAALEKSNAELKAGKERLRVLTEQLADAEARLKDLAGLERRLTEVQGRLEAAESEREALRQELEQQRESSRHEAQELERTLEEWTQRLATVEAERERLAGEVERLRSESGQTVGELQARLGAAEQDRAELLGRIEQLAQAEAERQRLQGQVEELTEELRAARDRVEGLEGRIGQLSDVNSRLIAERRELHSRIESLTRGGQTLEQEKQAAINAAQARVTELESALSRMAKALDATRSSSAQEIDRVRAELAAAAEERDGLREELSRLRGEMEARRAELEGVNAERDRVQQELEKTRHREAELSAQLEAERKASEKLQGTSEENARRLAALEAELAERTAARDALAQELAEARDRLAAEAREKAAAEAAHREVERALAAEQEARSSDVSSLQEELARVRAELNGQIEEMMRRHQAAEEAAQAECDRLSQALAEKERLLQSIEERLVTSELAEEAREEAAIEADLEIESMLAIDRSVGEEEVPEGAEVQPGETAPAEEVLLLDAQENGEPTSQALLQHGYKICVLSPDGELASHLKQRRVACAAINLGIPAAWSALRLLRAGEAGAAPSVIAYALTPGASTGFWFGPVDFTVLPVSEVVTELLQRMMPKVRRVIAMSADLDVMSDVREELNKGRISTAVVLDGRQALDLVPTVRPEAAVLHLSPSCTDVFRAIAGMRSSEFARDIPILFLLDAEPQPREEAFLAAGIRMLSGRGNLKATELVGALAETLSPYRRSG